MRRFLNRIWQSLFGRFLFHDQRQHISHNFPPLGERQFGAVQVSVTSDVAYLRPFDPDALARSPELQAKIEEVRQRFADLRCKQSGPIRIGEIVVEICNPEIGFPFVRMRWQNPTPAESGDAPQAAAS